MFEFITNAVLKEVNHAVDGVVKTIQRRVLRILLKAFFITAGIAALAIGIILMGAKYVGLDFMLIAVGVALVVAFFLS